MTRELTDAVMETFGAPPESVERLKGGANNVCTKVSVGGRLVLAKHYFSHPNDPRDRLNAEFDMLSFLWENGVRCIPKPLACDAARQLAFYTFIPGAPPLAGQIGAHEVDALADLLGTMHNLKYRPAAASLPMAADAATCMQDYLDNVGGRVERVMRRAADGDAPGPFRALAGERVDAVWRRTQQFVKSGAEAAGVALSHERRREDMTLSPADHGFHNTLRGPGGTLTFLDFEYAGWDDPAQMLCNACLQPAVPLPESCRPSFLRSVVTRLEADVGLVPRMRMVYPVLGLKWAMIMLNEFLPVGRDRRAFAGADTEGRRQGQLRKAEVQLQRVEAYLEGNEEIFDNIV